MSDNYQDPCEHLSSSDPVSDLKPCPFCGGTTIEICERSWVREAYASCAKCNTDGPLRETLEEAIKAWNTRHSDKEFLYYTECAACGSETASAVQVRANKDMVLVPREPTEGMVGAGIEVPVAPTDNCLSAWVEVTYKAMIQAWENEGGKENE